MNKSQKIFNIILGLLSVISLIAFIWHTELYMNILIFNLKAVFSNGVLDSSPVIMYHVLMYITIILNLTFVTYNIYYSNKR